MPKPRLLRRRTDGDMPSTFHLESPSLRPGLAGLASATRSKHSKALKRGGSNQLNLRPMPLLPYQRAVEVQVLPEVASPGSFKVDVSVPEICLPNPKVLLRRSTLPALDIKSEALMLSRQLHLDFHEVKFVLQELRSESEHGERLPNGGLEYGAFQQCLQRICGVELEEQWVVNAYKECRASEGPVDSEQLMIWYRDHIFNLEAFKLRKRFAAEKSGAPQVTLDLAKKFQCSCLDLDKMKVKFDDFDLDKSGFIDQYEFEKMMYQLLHCSSQSDFPKTRLDRFWNEADKNSDGQIDFEEFLEWYMKYFGTSYENGPMDAFYASFMPGVQRSNSLGELKVHKVHKVQEKISLKAIAR
eukprot:s359_g19.t1